MTAEHVISGLLTKGHEIYVRLNLKSSGASDHHIPSEHWRFHPDNERNPTDIAVCPFNEAEADFDFKQFALEHEMIATGPVLEKAKIGPGDEIGAVGLFRSHYGQEHNIPVVRIGHLAALTGEPVWTEYCGFTDAYLVELNSIGGLSGSPVLLNMAPIRATEGGGFSLYGWQTVLPAWPHAWPL